MSNIYVFYVSVSASVAKRRKFEEGLVSGLCPLPIFFLRFQQARERLRLREVEHFTALFIY